MKKFLIRLRKVFVTFALGAIGGAVLVSLVGPDLLAWYFEPPAFMGVTCQPAAVWAVHAFQKLQLGAIAVSGVLALILAQMLKKGPPKPKVPPTA
jgi:uncharacterized membrane protein